MNLENHLLELLYQKGGKAGLTLGEIRQKAGMPWRKALSRHQTDSSASEIRDFVHGLWKSGKIVVEPPTGRSQAIRIWHPKAAAKKFGSTIAQGDRPTFHPQEARKTYEKLARETRSPYVFISALVKRSKCRVEDLHEFLIEQESKGQAVLSTGDWSSATEEERKAVLETDGRRFIKVRLP